MNNYIRNFKYNTESKLVIGEKLLANSPIIIDEIIVFTTNDEFEVLSFEVKTEVINNGDYALEYYLAKVQYTNLQDGSKSVRDIKIIHENSEELYLKLLNILSNMAKSAKKKSDAIDAWSKYYMFKQHFADVKYNYAITAHKSQGSTYRNVFVIENDLNKNFNVRERNRIKYTAFTRASNNLIIIL
jgi:ATP-dependent exoDNAse (exonuclease V) alpha subunit